MTNDDDKGRLVVRACAGQAGEKGETAPVLMDVFLSCLLVLIAQLGRGQPRKTVTVGTGRVRVQARTVQKKKKRQTAEINGMRMKSHRNGRSRPF